MKIYVKKESNDLTLQAPTSQNCQTHLKNLFATADDCLSVFDHLVGLVLKGLRFQKM